MLGVVFDLGTEAKRRDRPILTEEALYRCQLAGVVERQIVNIAALAKTIGRQGFDVRQEQVLPDFSNRSGEAVSSL